MDHSLQAEHVSIRTTMQSTVRVMPYRSTILKNAINSVLFDKIKIDERHVDDYTSLRRLPPYLGSQTI